MRPWLVGEDNPHSLDPKFALYPYPIGVAGWRLAVKVLDLGEGEYLRRYNRTNLCSGKWDGEVAARVADAIRLEVERTGQEGTIVCLGAKVARAFDVFFAPFTSVVRGMVTYVILPHPSGRSRLWNEVGSYERARETMRAAGAL